jgi:quercetin dioxygenase-like cupin family protein
MLKQATELTPHPAPDAIVLGPDEGEAVWFLDNLITVKTRSADGVSFGVMENRLPAGSSTPFHRHDAEDEALYVLEGELTLFLDGGRTRRVGPGTYVHLRRGVAHGLRAETATRMLVLSDPAGFVEVIREAGTPAERRELPPPAAPDFARLEAACKRHDIVLLGPLPG